MRLRTPPTASEIVPRHDALVRLALRKAGQVFCRHTWLVVQSKHRLFLRCPTCQRESVGFTVGESAP